MDPTPIGSPQWTDIGSLLTNLWIVVIFVILFAANMLVGHNAIPSLVASGHLQESWQKLRPALYGAAIASFGLAVFFLSRAVDFAGVLREFWANFWI